MKKMLIKKLIIINIIMMLLALAANYLMKTGELKSIIIFAVFLLLTTIIQVIVVTQHLNKYFVNAVADVNKKLGEITHGNLDARIEVNTTEEFTELSGHINDMVKSLLETTDKLSLVLDNVELAVGVYEYGPGMARVRVTKQVANILFLEEEKAQRYLADYILFADYLDVLRSHPFDEEKHIYRVLGEVPKYIKMESFQKEENVFGVVTDVTEEIVEQLRKEQEKKEDLLTGLPSRNAFYSTLDELFEKPEVTKNSVLILFDVEKLMEINEEYGQEAGDRYLCSVAELFKTISPKKSILSRLTGGEFVLYLHSCEEESELDEYLEIFRKRKGKMISLGEEKEVALDFSYGCSYYEKDGKDYHDLMKLADERMYEEKRVKKEKVED